MKKLEINQQNWPILFRKYLLLLIFLNIFTLSLLFIYTLGFRLSFFGVFSSLVFIATFFLNCVFILLLERFLKKDTQFGKIQNVLVNMFLVFGIIAIIAIVFGGTCILFRLLLISLFYSLPIIMAFLSYKQLTREKGGFIWK
ncbi:MAG: hypothetical protein ACOC44_14300 [Promethearchaeia archaeon]